MRNPEPRELQKLSTLPDALLIALGGVTARFGQIEYLLTVTIKRTSAASWWQVFDDPKTHYTDKLREEARRSFSAYVRGDLARVAQFDDLLKRLKGLAHLRDAMVHACWVHDGTDTWVLRRGDILPDKTGNPIGIANVQALERDLHKELANLNSLTYPEYNTITTTPEGLSSVEVTATGMTFKP